MQCIFKHKYISLIKTKQKRSMNNLKGNLICLRISNKSISTKEKKKRKISFIAANHREVPSESPPAIIISRLFLLINLRLFPRRSTKYSEYYAVPSASTAFSFSYCSIFKHETLPRGRPTIIIITRI